jgi:hypothetical protein
LRPQIIEDDINFTPDLPMCIVGYAHAAGLRDPFEARGDVDAITKNIIVVDHDITDVNADAKFDPGILRYIEVLLSHSALDFDGATGCVYDAGELDQHAVASSLDNASTMFGDSGIDEFFP